MSLHLDSSKYSIFIGSDSTVEQVVDFKTKEPKLTDGIPTWTVKAELVYGDEVEQIKLKIVSDAVPVVKARTEYFVNGDLVATPWVADGARNASISYKVVGSLTTGKKEFPATKA